MIADDTALRPHCGPSNHRLRVHLALVVPPPLDSFRRLRRPPPGGVPAPAESADVPPVTVEIEATGAAAIPSLAGVRLAIEQARYEELPGHLEHIARTIRSMTSVLERMEERCRHAVFYRRIRPFLSGWPEPGVVYDGIDEQPVTLHGGSAAQSSLLNAFDAALSIPHEHPGTKPFLQAMRQYMPPRHRRFLEWLEEGWSLHEIADDHGLSARYDECIDALVGFR